MDWQPVSVMTNAAASGVNACFNLMGSVWACRAWLGGHGRVNAQAVDVLTIGSD